MRLDQTLEPFGQNMGVNLCRRDIGMAEQLLQAPQIRPVGQQM
jgi:hypothetical protein